MSADKFDRFDRDAPFWLKFIDQNGIGKFNVAVTHVNGFSTAKQSTTNLWPPDTNSNRILKIQSF